MLLDVKFVNIFRQNTEQFYRLIFRINKLTVGNHQNILSGESYYRSSSIFDAQLFLQPQLVPHREHYISSEDQSWR